jgi:hypothetical protein
MNMCVKIRMALTEKGRFSGAAFYFHAVTRLQRRLYYAHGAQSVSLYRVDISFLFLIGIGVYG